MPKLIRWVLVPISGVTVWYAVFLLGIGGVGLIDSLCPPELVISGSCTAAWHGPAVDALILLCTAIAAAGIVVVPALVAPSRRFLVAALAYALGATFAVYAASGGSLWGPFLVAAISGSAALAVASSRWRGSGY
jgi:hypothetical protein